MAPGGPCAHLCISDAQLVDVLDGGDNLGALVAHQLGTGLLAHDHDAGVAPICRSACSLSWFVPTLVPTMTVLAQHHSCSIAAY